MSETLKGAEAFGYAVAAGVPCDTAMEGGSVVMRLAHPVAVVRENGLVKVYSRPVREGSRRVTTFGASIAKIQTA